MKQYIYILLISLATISCADDFLDRYPHGKYHEGNFESSVSNQILTESKVLDAYKKFRNFGYNYSALAIHSYITNDAIKGGGTTTDGGDGAPSFETMGFTSSTKIIEHYYTHFYEVITNANEALALASTLPDSVANKKQLIAEAVFLRAYSHFCLAQAFGDIQYIDKIMDKNSKVPQRTSRSEVYGKLEQDILSIISSLPTRKENVASGNPGRATQNAARAVLAKVYLYQKKWGDVLTMTNQIIASGDNDLKTPFADIFKETQEFGSESVFEINVEFKPTDKIYMDSQYAQIQGIRGIPNLGWGMNAPSKELIDAFEVGDPRKAITVIEDGQTFDGKKVYGDGYYKFWNGKVNCNFVTESGLYGRKLTDQGKWKNIRLIRYADVLLMHAEAAVEEKNTGEAIAKLEMIRDRARGGNSSVPPKVTDTDVNVLREKVRHERRIELAMEFERFFDLVRWGIAKDVIPDFVVGKHEVFPIPQSEIDKSDGVLTQNPKY